eukprot:CAMPEP_0178570434 /NCGR_PEP_ID=MMETSP0697-20121206/17068_1 /TAXON_ID=265572 /ORGANISM="Extubocellulus spinifer, Strain CCMP396" /LENGTH=54 /DNA_ID=CAMNT_0020204857 /DNA_START=42 /DNA_END=202 /DNA_ORIENTATION=-
MSPADATTAPSPPTPADDEQQTLATLQSSCSALATQIHVAHHRRLRLQSEISIL